MALSGQASSFAKVACDRSRALNSRRSGHYQPDGKHTLAVRVKLPDRPAETSPRHVSSDKNSTTTQSSLAADLCSPAVAARPPARHEPAG